MKKLLSLVVCLGLVISLGALAGCGGGDKDKKPTTPPAKADKDKAPAADKDKAPAADKDKAPAADKDKAPAADKDKAPAK